jgi:hypothetical protein
MSDVPPQRLLSLIGNLSRNSTGFQNAHIIGQAFSTRFAGNWFSVVMGALGVNDPQNIIPLPETTQGGATLGVAVHSGRGRRRTPPSSGSRKNGLEMGQMRFTMQSHRSDPGVS